MGWMMLRPRPITTTEYHDWYLVGLSVSQGSAELLVKHYEGRGTVIIRFGGVTHLLASDFLAGNIIDHVTCHAIDSPETARLVMDELLDFQSQYFTERDVVDPRTAERLLGLTYVGVRPTYGAHVSVVAASVTEAEASA